MSTGEPAERDDKRGIVMTCVVLALVTLAVFLPARGFDFVNYDDADYVTNNPHVQAGLTWDGVTWAFGSGHASNWHPLTWLSHMLDTSLFGSGAGGPHFTNIVLHAANASLLFLLLMRMTGAKWRSAFVAALFALHPLHVESVAWVSERKDVLSTCFGLLALLMYERYVRSVECQVSGRAKALPFTIRHSSLFYGLTLLFFACGLMSKPMLVTLPFVMLLLDYWPLGRFTIYDLRFTNPQSVWSFVIRHSSLLREKLPFFALSVASCAATILAQQEAVQPLARISLGIRAVNAVVSYVRYLTKMVWPVELAVPYPHPGYGSFWLLCVSAALILTAFVVVFWLARKFPFMLTGWLWYLGMLVPVIGLMQVGMQSMADRYTYLPLVGVFIIIAWGACEAAARVRLTGRVMWAAAILVLAACTFRTRDQLNVWRNSETLFRHSIAVTKYNDVAHYNLGTYLFGLGRVDEAIVHLRKALQIRPSYNDARNNLASALGMKGELEEAAVLFREALRVQPEDAELHYNLGNVLALQRKLDEAVAEYTESLRLKPNDAKVHNNLGNVHLMQGHKDEAVHHFQEALRINPDHESARRQLQELGAQREAN